MNWLQKAKAYLFGGKTPEDDLDYYLSHEYEEEQAAGRMNTTWTPKKGLVSRYGHRVWSCMGCGIPIPNTEDECEDCKND